MNIRIWLTVLLIIILQQTAFSQDFSVTGTLLDETDNSPLIGVSVTLIPVDDSTQKRGGITDADGTFLINAPVGKYNLSASYIGFTTLNRTVNLAQYVDLGAISMKVAGKKLNEVVVTGEQIRAQQSGDTTSFNAGSYKTNPDASAEDLVNKMPGISTDGGTVKAQGEDIKQVLIDGKPFFGDDPNAALKNLPAEIIDKIQVYDRASDQAQLTGFDDGNAQKTINIITKPGRNTGQFGKIFGGLGINDNNNSNSNTLYSAGGNVNFFKGDTRVSLIALSNNVNQQNFSTDDLLGVVGTSSGQGRGGAQGGSSRGGNRGGGRSDAGGRGGGGDAGNFLVGQQGGITQTHSAGINYSDSWGKKVKVTGSYFFNNTNNTNNNNLSRKYFAGSDSNLVYAENSITTTKNTNHRANLRLEYEIDTNNSLILTPRISYQQNEYERNLNGVTTTGVGNTILSNTNNKNTSKNDGYTFNNNLLYRHKFAKRGRTLSVNFGTQLNDRSGEGSLYSLNSYTEDDTLTNDITDQRNTLNTNGYTLSGSVNYTEPISKNSQLMVSYAPSYNNNHSEKITNNKAADGGYSDLDTLLSNRFDNTYTTHRGGLDYRFNNEKIRASVGVNYQQAILTSDQIYPRAFSLDRSFSNILPSAMMNYKFTRNKNLRLMYRTNTNAPSISQLQNVVDNSNPLLLKTGNAGLTQAYQHMLTLRYGATNSTKATNFFVMLMGNYTQDYISNATFLPSGDTTINDVTVNRGVQLSMPVNMDGYSTLRSFATYGMPLKVMKSNLNLNAGVNYSRIPAIINNQTNYANNYTLTGGLVLGSNINENIDFTVSYNANYNVVRNTLQGTVDNNYFYQTTSGRLNWLFLNGFVLNTTITHTLYSGLAQGFNQNFVLWNAGFGYKFFKDRSLDVRMNVYDLLNQNRAIERSVTETYIEDSYTNVLQRYFMLNVTYTLRRFAGSKMPQNADVERGPRGGRDMGDMPSPRDRE